MITRATSRIKPDFRRNRLLQGLLGLCIGVWVVTAIAPHNRFDWFLENLLVWGFGLLLLASYRRFPLSDLSYLLIAAFTILHLVGAHYTYSRVPLGFWLQDPLALERNHYDRLIHFGFGLLIVYPIWETALRAGRLRGPWGYLFALCVAATMSLGYEILEWIVAAIVSPEAALAYLGTQGDVFDAQKDSALAVLGALLGLGAIAAHSRIAAAARCR